MPMPPALWLYLAAAALFWPLAVNGQSYRRGTAERSIIRPADDTTSPQTPPPRKSTSSTPFTSFISTDIGATAGTPLGTDLGTMGTDAGTAPEKGTGSAVAGPPPWEQAPAVAVADGSGTATAWAGDAIGADADAFRVKAYGALWADMLLETQPTNPGAFTLWVFSREVQEGEQFVVDARRSRLGLEIEGPELPWGGGAASRGRFEIDFFGQFVTENQANLLLRHAYWEAEHEDFRILVGQSWDVISPRSPRMLNYSVGWAGGNIGFRRAQFRWDRYVSARPGQKWIWQTSLNQDIISDFATEPEVRREPTVWPVLESRVAVEWGGAEACGGPWQLGLSAHAGQSGFDFATASPPPLELPPQDNVRLPTWSVNLDWLAPLSRRCSLQGELFVGENLSAYLGGIVQGVCGCTRGTIRSRGGWMDLSYVWSERLSSATGFGLDDPVDSDLLFGRTRNQFLFANVTYRIVAALETGLEVAYWQTRYDDRRAGRVPAEDLAARQSGNAVVVEWMWKYAF